MQAPILQLDPQCFSADCPSRALFDQIADKWSAMVLAVLDEQGPQRFNAIKRRLEGVTQKALTQCLRRLERNGLVSRQVIPMPLAVQYEITPLGRTLVPPLRQLHAWTLERLPQVEQARQAFDARGTP